MTEPRKMPRWRFILQWAALAFVIASVAHTGFTEGGWRVLLAGFSLGIVTMSIVISSLIAKMFRHADEAHHEYMAATAAARDMAQQLQDAINNGRIEVIPVQPDQPTRH